MQRELERTVAVLKSVGKKDLAAVIKIDPPPFDYSRRPFNADAPSVTRANTGSSRQPGEFAFA
eukprot:6612319-Prymnesium_polylepis.1